MAPELAVLISWIIFELDTPARIFEYLADMFGFGDIPLYNTEAWLVVWDEGGGGGDTEGEGEGGAREQSTRTSEPITIPASKTVSFKAAPKFKDSL